jgi:ATP-dependent Clp protease ATP-binding subunit ClpC
MFDRFTDRARKVMGLSRQEAVRLHHDCIGTEHMLLGLVSEGSGVGAAILRMLDIDLDGIPQKVEALVDSGTDMLTRGQLPFTVEAKKTLEGSLEEASELGHSFIGTEHLLLGLIGQEQGIAAQVLRDLGVKHIEAKRAVLELLGEYELPREPAVGQLDGASTAGGLDASFRHRLDRMEQLVCKLAQEIESLRSQLT